MSTSTIQIRKQHTDIPGGFAVKRNHTVQADPSCALPAVIDGPDGAVKRKRLNPINESIDVCMQDFKNSVNDMSTTNTTDRALFLVTIREVRRLAIRILPEDTHFLQKLLTLGLLPYVTQTIFAFGDCDDAESGHILFEAIWILVELSSRKGTFANSIRYSGAASVANLVKLMGKNHSTLRENTAWLLSNLVADNAGFHQTVLQEPLLLRLLVQNMAAASEQNLSMVTTCAWTMSNLFCTSGDVGDSTIPLWAVLEWVPIVVSKLNYVVQKRLTPELCIDLMSTLNHLTRHSPEARDAVFRQENGVIVVTLNQVIDTYGLHPEYCFLQMVIPALQSLTAFASSTDETQVAAITKRTLLWSCLKLLETRKFLVQQMTFAFFAAIAANKNSQVKRSLVDANIMKMIIGFAAEGVTKIQQAALLTLTTIITTSNFGSRVYSFGCLKPFCYYLGRECADVQVLVAILEAVYSLFSECTTRRTKAFVELRGTEYLDALVVDHPNELVVKAAERILTKYFRCVEDEASPPTKRPTTADRNTISTSSSAVMTHPKGTNITLFQHNQRDDADFSPPTSKRLFPEATTTTPPRSSSNAFGGSLYMNTGY